MVDQANNQNQSRFLMAAVASMVVLFAWSYFFAPTPPPENANTAANTNTAAAQPTPAAPAEQAQQPIAPAAEDATPNRTITIRSPLYEVTRDSKGAVATSCILLRNKTPRGDTPIYRRFQ